MGCQEGTVQAVWCPLPQEEAQQQLYTWLFNSFTFHRFPGVQMPPPSSLAQLSMAAATLPSFLPSPAACTSWGQTPCPAGLPRQGETLSSRDAEPLGSSLAQSRPLGAAPIHSPVATMAQDGAISQRTSQQHQAPARKSIRFITDPKAPVAVPRGPHLHRMFPLLSKGKRRGEQTQLTQLMALWC